LNRTKIDVAKLIELLEIYKNKGGTITIHMIEKLVYHLANGGDIESIEHGLN